MVTMKIRIIVLVQARSDSRRLPRKVLKNILGKPMIIHQLQRVSKSKYLDELILVTSDESSDNILGETVLHYGFKLFRGDKNNVLKRFFDAVAHLKLKEDDVIVRLTGDCPLHDSVIIDESIKQYLKEDCDYLANCIKPIYPDGFDVEVFSFKSLETAYLNASKTSQLEHVTPYIRDCGLFIVENLRKNKIIIRPITLRKKKI